jgi:hypothetical protein
MTAEHPVFGVGLGRFREMSEAYMPVGYAGTRENAHNNFLQVSAELGLTGFAVFAALLAAGLHASWRTDSVSGWGQGVLLGLVAFLLTCLAGHPLLVAGAALPFWLLLGLGVAGTTARQAVSPRWSRVGAALLVLFLASIPFRAATAVAQADLEHLGIGLSLWQRDEEGLRYRWAGGRSTLFVPADASAVRIPLRHGGHDPRRLEIAIFLEGREADRIVLEAEGGWRIFRLLLRDGERPRFLRVDLIVRPHGQPDPLAVEPTDTSGAVMIGRVLSE